MARAAKLEITATYDWMKLQIAERYFRCRSTDPEKAEYLAERFRLLSEQAERERDERT